MVIKNRNHLKQECIPVRCVPPAAVAVPGGFPPGTPPEQNPPGSDPPGAHPPGPGTPPLWTESQTPVKTLPCPNFVAGGKKPITVSLLCMKCVKFWITYLFYPFVVEINGRYLTKSYSRVPHSNLFDVSLIMTRK